MSNLSETNFKRVGLPIGSVINTVYTSTSGLLLCDGSSVLRADYPELFDVIGTIYGNVDSTHFNLPDYRGYHLRCQDSGAGIDPDAADRTDRGDGTDGDNVGTEQAAQILYHTHNASQDPVVTNDTRLYTMKAGAVSLGPASGDGTSTPPVLNTNLYIVYE
jgi:microcystin-dependent protein